MTAHGLRPCRRASRRTLRPRQRGISLVIGLVLLLIVTLLALGSMRGVVLQARMSGSTHDRSLAFEAAEAALREAERRAATVASTDFPATACSTGLCATPALAAAPRWLDDSFAGWQAATAAVPADAPAPQAIVEDMGDAPNWLGCENEIPRQPNCTTRRYRVSSRSTADGRASVVLQSQYAAP
jgi:type IV pilus assembly protein PilX